MNDGGGRLADRSELIKDLIQGVDLIKMDSQHQAIFTGDPVALRDLVHPFCFLDYFLQLSRHQSHSNKSAHRQSDGLRINNGLETAAVFAVWKRPIAILKKLDGESARLLFAFATVLAAMNTVFYYAIAALPLTAVGAIESLGPITLAAIGVRNLRNLAALVLAIAGVVSLTKARFSGQLGPFVLAFANCLLFSFYIVLGHKLSRNRRTSGVNLLAAAMCIASLIAAPFGAYEITKVVGDPVLLFAGIGVGICSSVLPYVCDQLAMARLPRSSFALLLWLLPATATVIGIIVLRQVPSEREIIGVALVIAGIAAHQPPDSQEPKNCL